MQVEVWGEKITLSIHRQSASVWIARGDYKGKSYEGKGSSARSAAASWCDQARYFAN